MTRQRVSTTVDAELLAACRARVRAATDAELLDQALRALLAAKRRAEIDATYEAYEQIPLDTPDEWGDLQSFLESVRRGTPRPGSGSDTGNGA